MFKDFLKPYIEGYKNVGKTIKEWAIFSAILEAIGAIITGIVFLCDLGIEDGWWALFIIFFGPIAAWILSLFPYAFGELVEDIHAMRNKEGITEGDEVKESEDDMQAEEKFIADINEEEKLTPLTVKTTIDTPKTEDSAKTLPCPECGEDLGFVGWDENDLNEIQICPLCVSVIEFNP